MNQRIIEKYDLKEIVINGKRGYFTSNRVIKKDVPNNYCLYQVRHSDDQEDPCTIEPRVVVNHYGDLLLQEVLEFTNPNDPYIDITEDEKEELRNTFY